MSELPSGTLDRITKLLQEAGAGQTVMVNGKPFFILSQPSSEPGIPDRLCLPPQSRQPVVEP
jgi:hypothetical protein